MRTGGWSDRSCDVVAISQYRPAMDLFDEEVGLARDLIRLDTTNSLGVYPGNETFVARHLADYLGEAGIECELVAKPDQDAPRQPGGPHPGDRPGRAEPGVRGPHRRRAGRRARLDAPAVRGVVDDDGYLWGRGALDMKGEVAARAVAIKELARSGFRPRGDLWFLAVADEEDGMADVGMRWLLEARPDIRPTMSVNEGGGERFELSDGRRAGQRRHRREGHLPRPRHRRRARPATAARRRSATTRSRTSARCSPASAADCRRRCRTRSSTRMLRRAAGRLVRRRRRPRVRARRRRGAAPRAGALMPALAGTTMAPTMVGASDKRNVMPSRAWVELDCRILPGTTKADVEAAVRDRLGAGPRLRPDLARAAHRRQRLAARRRRWCDAIASASLERGRRGRAAAEPGHRVHRLGRTCGRRPARRRTASPRSSPPRST